MRMGILSTDKVRDHLLDTYGDYPDMFEQLFGSVDPTLQFARYDALSMVPQTIDCDVYLVTGSRYSAYDSDPWIKDLVTFLQRVLAAKKKIIGICFGHQLMAHHFGGRVGAADAGWGVGVKRYSIVQPEPWMSDTGQRTTEHLSPEKNRPPVVIDLISSHKDQVLKLPEEAKLFAGSDFCPLAGFTIGDQVITIQGHPEFSPAYAQELLNLRVDIIGAQMVASASQSLSQPTHGQLLAAWMLNFVGNPASQCTHE